MDMVTNFRGQAEEVVHIYGYIKRLFRMLPDLKGVFGQANKLIRYPEETSGKGENEHPLWLEDILTVRKRHRQKEKSTGK